MWSRFLAVFIARNKEFVRDRSALGWNLIFPVLIVGGFAFAFDGEAIDLYKVGVLGEQQASLDFFNTDYVHFIPVDDAEASITKVDRHQLDMVIDAPGHHYWINETSPKGYILERVLRGSGGADFNRELLSGAPIRYVDWVVPGILAMNMMWSALYGVGFVIVRYRKNGVLKRLKATPLNAMEFLTAQLVSRLFLILAVTVVVFIGTDAVIHFRMHGSYLNLLLVYALGTFSLIALGLVIAARTASEELAGGLINVFSWPMMFLSGVWFSLEGLHPLVQKLAQVFPLTHMLDALRAIMIDGATLLDILPQLTILAVMSAILLAIGAWLFRWE